MATCLSTASALSLAGSNCCSTRNDRRIKDQCPKECRSCGSMAKPRRRCGSIPRPKHYCIDRITDKRDRGGFLERLLEHLDRGNQSGAIQFPQYPCVCWDLTTNGSAHRHRDSAEKMAA